MSAAYRGRVRTGCLACRSAKVKCDEQHPICRRCVRQHKRCVYARKRSQKSTASSTKDIDGDVIATLSSQAAISTPANSPARPSHSPAQTTAQQPSQASPSLLATLVSQDIYLCTTIDYIAAVEGRPSYTYFHRHFDCPFIAPYDPANWVTFKDMVLAAVPQNIVLARATEAAQAVHRARRNALPHACALASYKMASEALRASLDSEKLPSNESELLFAAIFLLALVEMMLPEETDSGILGQPMDGRLTPMQDELLANSPPSSLTTRLAAWFLLCHAAARRSGNRGLLSVSYQQILGALFDRSVSVQTLQPTATIDPDHTLLATLTEPLFIMYVHTQIISSQVADLSHYHRSRTRGEDQEEVTAMMAAYKLRLDQLCHNRPALMRHGVGELPSRFTSSKVADALDLLCTLCMLIFDTELVEMGRNLSQEQSTTPEACVQLKQMMSVISAWVRAHEGAQVPPAFTRALLLCAIESNDRADSQWAVANMRRIHDPICYSDFFANFSEGLADTQRRMGRRVTTRWFGLEAFGVSLPFL